MEWPSNDDLFNAEARVGAKLAELLEVLVMMGQDLPSTEMVGLRECLRPDPDDVVAECERLRKSLRHLEIEKTPIDVAFGRAGNRLDGWQGRASQEFRDRLLAIASVQEEQRKHLERATIHSLSLLALIANIRLGYLTLANETVAALEAAITARDKRAAKTFVALGADLIKDALNMDPGKLLTGSIGMLVTVAKNLSDSLIDASDPVEILQQYRSADLALRDEFVSGLNELSAQIATEMSELAFAKTLLADPLPVTTDIHSPNFDYANFSHPEAPIEEYRPKVAVEHKRVAAEVKGFESDISKRLGGGV